MRVSALSFVRRQVDSRYHTVVVHDVNSKSVTLPNYLTWVLWRTYLSAAVARRLIVMVVWHTQLPDVIRSTIHTNGGVVLRSTRKARADIATTTTTTMCVVRGHRRSASCCKCIVAVLKIPCALLLNSLV